MTLVLLLTAIVVGILLVVNRDEARPLETPTAADIAAEPAAYYGEKVSISGEVDATYNLPARGIRKRRLRTFTVATDEDAVLRDSGLLVIPTVRAKPRKVAEGDSVEVEAVVESFFRWSFRGAFGALPTDFRFGAGERPVLLATAVSKPRRGGGNDTNGQGSGNN